MNFNNLDELKNNQFEGFLSIEELWQNNSIIPNTKGVYLIINPYLDNIDFLEHGVGGFFKNKNPNISIKELSNNFVPNSLVIYIGKAGTLNNKSTLKTRIKQYLKFGQGKKVGHWGGRFIWQLTNHKKLLICWKNTENIEPREIEKLLISQFKLQFNNQRPFANLKD